MSSKVVTFGEIMLRLAPMRFLRLSQANNFDLVCIGNGSSAAISQGACLRHTIKRDAGECSRNG